MAKSSSPSASANSEWEWIGRAIGVVGILAVFAMAIFNAAGMTPRETVDWAKALPQHALDAAGRAVGAVAGTRCALHPCDDAPAADALAGLRIEPESHANTYRRPRFGTPWADTDHNGCDTRNDMLRRDLQQVQLKGGSKCVVIYGLGADPYTGEAFTFTKANADVTEPDHVVALAEAWQSGAWDWTDARRKVYANDPDVLQMSLTPVNRAKDQYDAAQPWKQCTRRANPSPSQKIGRCLESKDDRPTGARGCTYARKVIAIKKEYGLTVDTAEFDALNSLLRSCA
jgi:hypothetical protein